jgi:hypothetical protein
MPFKPHPTDPDKMVYVSQHYDIPQLQGVTTPQRPSGVTNYAHLLMVKCFNEEHDKHKRTTMDKDDDINPTPPAAQPAQEPASVTYKEVQDSMNALEKGTLYQQVIAEELGQRKLYAAPPQRPWKEPTGNDWFEWWRVSKVTDATEAEIDFADFLIIVQAIAVELKEKNT